MRDFYVISIKFLFKREFYNSFSIDFQPFCGPQRSSVTRGVAFSIAYKHDFINGNRSRYHFKLRIKKRKGYGNAL